MKLQKNLLPLCSTIGEHLRDARQRRFPGDDQQTFARRLGVSRETLRKMEHGNPGVALGRYLEAAELLDCLDGFRGLFEPARDLFEEAGL